MARRGLSTERLVEVAAAIADAEGARALTMARVAGELGVRTPSLYAHCAGFGDLQRLLQLRALTVLGAEVQRAAVGRAGEDAVRAIAHAYRGFARVHPGLYPFIVPSTEGTPAGIGDVQRASDEILETVLAVLEGLGHTGEEGIHAARLLRSALHGFVHLEAHGGFGLPVHLDASFERLVDGLLVALGPAGADSTGLSSMP